MNVMNREKRSLKTISKPKKDLCRRNTTLGICRSTTFSSNYKSLHHQASRSQFKGKNEVLSKKVMGPPPRPPPSLKRKLHTSSSTIPESSLSGQGFPRVIANESATVDSSEFTTPKKRSTALRYISSSSRDGHSSTRSVRSTSTSIVEASVILAISEGRGMARGEIGMAAIDIRQPHLVLCQFSDTLLYTHTLTKINFFNPVEVIVPHTFCEGGQPNQLYHLIKDQYPFVNVTTVQRRHFNDAVGRQNIQTLCAPQYSAVYLQVFNKFYALTAAAAVLKYVEYIKSMFFARASLKIEYHSSENSMYIDVGTSTQLELVQPLEPSAGPTCCLLGILGPTYTVGGIRALRAAILQPPCKKEFIEARLDAVQELIDNDSGLMHDLKDVLKKLSEIDKILFLCIDIPNLNMNKYGEAQLNQVLLLKTTIEVVPTLVEVMKSVESGRLKKIKMDFENRNYKDIDDRIRHVIQDDAHLEKGAPGSIQRCFAVKPEINGLLDVARRTYSELIEDIQKIVEKLSETYDMPIRLNQNVTKGFHIVMPVAPKNRRHFNVEELPSVFIQVVFNGVNVTMTTEELVVLDLQAREKLNEIQKMSNMYNVIATLLHELRPFMSSLYKLCENVAELDILLALAQVSTIGSYIRPEFDSYLEIRNSVHPLLDYNTQVMPVANDIFASLEYNFTMITGPNMGGKSIYIKQIAILHIMAQIGCFLPATKAVLRLCDRIYSRIGFNDSVESNASTYVIEMKETQHILEGLSSSSLVIIDELCRGTSVEEGTSLAWAICEQLIMSEAFTFFTTHFLYLTRLQDLYNNVVNCHTAVTEEVNNSVGSERKLIYKHKIEPGITKIVNYGLALAARTNLPVDTVNLAKELAEVIAKTKEPEVLRSPMKTDEDKLYEFSAKISHELRKTHSDERIRTMMARFKNENPQIIEKLKEEKLTKSNKSDLITISTLRNRNEMNELNISNEDVQRVDNKNNCSEIAINSDSSTYQNKSDQEYNHKNKYYESICVKSSNELLSPMSQKKVYEKNSSCLLNSSYENSDLQIQNLDSDRVADEIIDHATSNSKYDIVNSQMETLKNVTENFNYDNDNNNSTNVIETNNSSSKSNNINFIEDFSEIDQNEKVEMNFSNPNLPKDSHIIVAALTRSLKENSDEFLHLDTSSQLFSDEELMIETINEINKELSDTVAVEDIILTPPIEFRE